MRMAVTAILCVVPFLFGALVSAGLMPGVSSPFTGLIILQTWGTAFLAFSGGILWGSAMQKGEFDILLLIGAFVPVFLSLPVAFWSNAMLALIAGVFIVQLITFMFYRAGIIAMPWLGVSVGSNTVAMICLAIGAMA